jgi:UDP-N-acetyl-D-galactosamine dehydrogenase
MIIREIKNKKICVIGLGYVGLPLALEFGKKYDTIGFDINTERVDNLKLGIDNSKENTYEDIKSSKKLIFTSDGAKEIGSDIYIIAVPTPIDIQKKPNLEPLISASTIVGKVLKAGDIVIFESTVYPGCTEDVCVPLLEKFSKMITNAEKSKYYTLLGTKSKITFIAIFLFLLVPFTLYKVLFRLKKKSKYIISN